MKFETDVCVAGAGPAGMVLGLLLARLGIRVLVLEHHEDFRREYRGEVLMPRFTQMFRQIGLFDFIEKYHHLKLTELEGFYKNHSVFKINFHEICPEAPFAIWMPQPVFLDALHDKAKTCPSFNLWFGARAEGLIQEGGQTRGVTVMRRGEKTEVRAKITVGADGRFSVLRKRGGFELEDQNHDFDILWFTIPKPAGDNNKVRFFISPERNHLILPKYPEALQCGLIIAKDEFGPISHRGIGPLRQILLNSNPLFHPFAENLKDFSPFNVLQAKIERVKEWAKDGLLLVGDSAHTCSPAGAIGVSVAISSAITGADVIHQALQAGDTSRRMLGKLQEIMGPEVRHIQDRQKVFSRGLLNTSSWNRLLLPLLLFAVSKSGALRNLQRDLLVRKNPLPVSSDLYFT